MQNAKFAHRGSAAAAAAVQRRGSVLCHCLSVSFGFRWPVQTTEEEKNTKQCPPCCGRHWRPCFIAGSRFGTSCLLSSRLLWANRSRGRQRGLELREVLDSNITWAEQRAFSWGTGCCQRSLHCAPARKKPPKIKHPTSKVIS